MTPRGCLLEKLGLHRPELRAWAMYDWANSGFITTIVTAIFPIYFVGVAADVPGMSKSDAGEIFFIATTISMAIAAVISPYLGALADATGRTKRMLAESLAVGVAATAGLFLVERGDWVMAAVLFGLGNVAAAVSFVFYDSLLPHVAREEEMDRVSTAGYALGYVGGGLLLALNLAWIMKPEVFGLPPGDDVTLPKRLAFLSVAVWWLVFSIPLFRRVSRPPARGVPPDQRRPLFVAAFAQLQATYREVRRYPQAFRMLCAFLLFNDGIGTVFRAGALYATAIHVPRDDVIIAIVLVQFVGIPFAFAFGAVASRFGPKRSIMAALAAYVVIVTLAFFLRTTAQFYAMALSIAVVQGGAQALSRSLFASMIPAGKSAEFFGFFSVVEKFAGLAGPAVFALVIHVTKPWFVENSTKPLRCAVLSLVPFFVGGMWLLARVDVDAGRAQAHPPRPTE